MELKKNPKADLGKMKGLFFSIGLIITLLAVITAFEWKFADELEATSLGSLEEEETEILDIPITEMAPPPPPQAVESPEIIEVPDEEEIQETIEEVFEEPEKNVIVSTTVSAPVANPGVSNPNAPVGPPAEEPTDEIFLVVEESAQPKGGMGAFYKFLAENIKYPKKARKMGIEGRVIVEMVVGKDGSLTDLKVLKGIGGGCDEEAIRVLKTAPKWIPAKQRGRAVRQRMTLPVNFRFQ